MNRRTFLNISFLGAASALFSSACTRITNSTNQLSVPGLEAGVPVPRLAPRGCVGVIAPASTTSYVEADITTYLSTYGYSVKMFPSTHKKLGYLAGSDDERLSDLHAAFADKAVNAIICLRGGYGSARLLERIDFNVIQANPKPFVGYSDITSLHIAIANYTNLVTFHGPMLTSDLLASKKMPTEANLFSMIQGEFRPGSYFTHPATLPLTTLSPGVAQGKLVGGNLSIICASLGTPYEINTDGCILFLEEISEKPFRIDRLLTQLRLAGKFKQLRGVLIGNFDPINLMELGPILKQELGPLNIPILAGWSSGHCDPNLTLPLNARITLDASQQKITLNQMIVV